LYYLTGDSELADILNYVTLRAMSDAECRITYGNQLGQNMVCFEGNYNEGTCFVSCRVCCNFVPKTIFIQGDSGSPVVVRVSRGYDVAIAIASFFSSNGCESTDPSGFTKVFPYNDWIRNITAS
jgi:secreted trypsin-like serine protease